MRGKGGEDDDDVDEDGRKGGDKGGKGGKGGKDLKEVAKICKKFNVTEKELKKYTKKPKGKYQIPINGLEFWHKRKFYLNM